MLSWQTKKKPVIKGRALRCHDRDTNSHLIDEFCHVLGAVILQPQEVEQLRNLPHLHHVVLTHHLSQRLPTDALESRQQIHVSHAQHVKHIVFSELGIKKCMYMQSGKDGFPTDTSVPAWKESDLVSYSYVSWTTTKGCYLNKLRSQNATWRFAVARKATSNWVYEYTLFRWHTINRSSSYSQSAFDACAQ